MRLGRESLAVAFADAVAEDHTAISDGQVRVVRDEFTIPEIVELLIWISFEYAGQMFGCLIGDEPASAEERQAFAASIASLPTPPGASSSRTPATQRSTDSPQQTTGLFWLDRRPRPIHRLPSNAALRHGEERHRLWEWCVGHAGIRH